MSVHNGGGRLRSTIDSILAQTERDFELIAIDDGSTDDTWSILQDYARYDPRVLVRSQQNAGLTRSLIRGCAAARGDIIARHDCGDVSHPERFERQLAALADSATVLASCFVRIRAPRSELLYDVQADGDAIRDGLLHADAAHIRTIPHHGSAMFPRDAYHAAGGYREAFRYAQDLDLWIRMAALGRIAIVPEVLYEATLDVGTLSANARAHQLQLRDLAVQLRDSPSHDQQRLLQRASAVIRKQRPTPRDDARMHHFIAACLYRNGDPAWRDYARAAVRNNPLHLRTWVLVLRGMLR